MTKDGIVYNLKETPYIISVGKYEYHFSSLKHLQKWAKGLTQNRIEISRSLSNRFKIPVEVLALADLALYKKIETRGFYVLEGGVEVCQFRI